MQTMQTIACPIHGASHQFIVTRREALVGMAAIVVCACGASKDEVHAPDVKAPYPSWNASIANDYQRTLPDGTTARYVTRNAGQKEINGAAYSRFRMERPTEPGGDPPATGAELWMNPEGESKVVIAGGAYTSETATKLGLPGEGSATLQEPFTFDFGAKVGEPRDFDVKGTVSLKGTTTTAVVALAGSYTIVEKDVTVDTPTGKVAATHVSLEGKVPLVFGANLVQTSGELWISRTLGVVKAKFDDPLAGFGVGAKGTRTARELSGGYSSVESVAVVGGGVSRFELDTGDAYNDWDADKNTHAKMLMEIRWVDDGVAKTDKKPFVRHKLGTVMGYFPSELVQSPISFLHPEENGQGYVYWIAYADQAAKNEAGDGGTRYVASVEYEADFSPLRVSARTIYKRLKPS